MPALGSAGPSRGIFSQQPTRCVLPALLSSLEAGQTAELSDVSVLLFQFLQQLILALSLPH